MWIYFMIGLLALLVVLLVVYIIEMQCNYNRALKRKIQLTDINYQYKLKEQELIFDKSKLVAQISKLQLLVAKQSDEIDDLMARKELMSGIIYTNGLKALEKDMKLIECIEILNENYHLGVSDWYEKDFSTEYNLVRSEDEDCSLTEFEAIAVAEKYEQSNKQLKEQIEK